MAAKMMAEAPEATAQAIMAWVNMTEPDESPLFSKVPQIVGPENRKEPFAEWSPLETLWEQHHQIIAIDSSGCPLAEVLSFTQLTSFHITELEMDTTDTSLSAIPQHVWLVT
jgi:hypothetical protein